MTSQYRHRRTSVPATPFPTLEPGEIAVNTANRQLALGDAASGTLGAPKSLLTIRFFDISAQYATNDYVVQNGIIYRANVPISPGAFNVSNWTVIANPGTFVLRAGDTMTGHLSLPTAPAAANAVRKDYVDAADTALTAYIDAKPAALLISDTPPPSPAVGTLWWESDSGLLYIYYNDGTSSQWVIASPMPDFSVYAPLASPALTGSPTLNGVPVVTTNVRYDTAQALTAAQQQQSRQNIYAAPFDAMAYSGMQINGGMEVNQERAGTFVNVSGLYIVDGWKMVFSGTMVSQGQQGLTTTVYPGFSASIAMTVATAQASLGANDYSAVFQPIEGYRIARLQWGLPSAQPITLCFWSNHHRAGLYSGTVRNSVSGTPTRTYAFTYTHAVADVPQYNSIVIPGDTAGVWASDNTIGIYLLFSNGAGSSMIAPSANAWIAGSYHAAPGQVNGVAATTDIFRITGVTILPGTQAPTAAQSPLIMRPFDQELQACRRYWQRIDNFLFGADNTPGASLFYAACPLSPVMRATPTGAITAASYGGSSSAAVQSATVSAVNLQAATNGPTPAYVFVTFTADARL